MYMFAGGPCRFLALSQALRVPELPTEPSDFTMARWCHANGGAFIAVPFAALVMEGNKSDQQRDDWTYDDVDLIRFVHRVLLSILDQCRLRDKLLVPDQTPRRYGSIHRLKWTFSSGSLQRQVAWTFQAEPAQWTTYHYDFQRCGFQL